MNHVVRLATILVALLASAASVRAQDIEPRAYSNIPLGVNFLIAGYAWSQGGLATDPSLPLEDADIRTQTMAVAYARSIEVRGQSGKIDVVLPFAALSGSGEYFGVPTEREISGMADPRLRLSVNLYGAPAMSVEEHAAYRQDTIVGVSVVVSVPAGQYDDSRLINLGTNRWFVRSEVGMSKALGRWTLELAPAITLFEDNEDFYGGRTREQDPVYSLQAGVTYGFRNGAWVALNGTYYAGGRTAVDGERKQDRQENTLVGLTLARPVDRHNSIKLYASTGVTTRIGTDADTVGLAWQHRWGGGL